MCFMSKDIRRLIVVDLNNTTAVSNSKFISTAPPPCSYWFLHGEWDLLMEDDGNLTGLYSCNITESKGQLCIIIMISWLVCIKYSISSNTQASMYFLHDSINLHGALLGQCFNRISINMSSCSIVHILVKQWCNSKAMGHGQAWQVGAVILLFKKSSVNRHIRSNYSFKGGIYLRE